MPLEEPTERDYALMDRVLQEARAALAAGGAGVAALLASPNKIIAVGLRMLPSQIRAIGEFSYLSGEILRTLRMA
jgi:tRNA(Arg) A34 adenosine deaminase TadA